MNKVIITGRLAGDADYRTGNTNVARYTLAVDRPRKKGEDPTADFIRCVAFGQRADFASKYLKKGTKILVEGRIQTGSYKDQDGKTVYTTDVVVDGVEFLESKKNSSNTTAAAPAQTAAPSAAPAEPQYAAQQTAPQPQQEYEYGDFDRLPMY